MQLLWKFKQFRSCPKKKKVILVASPEKRNPWLLLSQCIALSVYFHNFFFLNRESLMCSANLVDIFNRKNTQEFSI